MTDTPTATAEDTTRTYADDVANAEASAGLIDPDSPAPRLAVPTRPTTDELREAARRALIERATQMAYASDVSGLAAIAEALRAIEYA